MSDLPEILELIKKCSIMMEDSDGNKSVYTDQIDQALAFAKYSDVKVYLNGKLFTND